MTTCFSPMIRTDSATRIGSFQSTSLGMPVFTAQKRQPRVHVSPKIMNVAVLRSLQHSCKFGHRASSHTVFNCFSRINFFSSLYDSLVLILIFNHSGLRKYEFCFAIFTIRSLRQIYVLHSTLSSDISFPPNSGRNPTVLLTTKMVSFRYLGLFQTLSKKHLSTSRTYVFCR